MKKPHPFDPALLTIFIEIAQTGSFTRAAHALRLSQSTVSAAIQRLEQAVGRRLFVRSAHTMRLTEDGESMMSYAQQMFALTQDAMRQLTEPRLAGVIRIGLPYGLQSPLLTEVLLRFRAIRPNVKIVVRNDQEPALLRLLDTGVLDVAIIATVEDRPGRTRIWSDELAWTGEKQLVASGRGRVPLVVRARPSMLRHHLTRLLEAAGRPYAIHFESDTLHDLIAAARAGLGLCILPRAMVPADMPIIQSRYLLPSAGLIHYELRHAVKVRELAQVFIDLITSVSPAFFEPAIHGSAPVLQPQEP